MEQNTSQTHDHDDATQHVQDAAAPRAAEHPTGEPAEKQEPRIIINDRRFWAQGEVDDEAEPEARKPHYVQELEQKLEEKETRLQETLVQYKEAKDEFEAARARLRRDITREIEAGKRSMLADILEVMDNLHRAIEAAPKDDGAPNALLQGVEMVRDQFLAKLQSLGVNRLDALNQPFNPAHHEAVSVIPVADASQDGMVLGVVRDGYLIGDETLRYGMVAVGKFSAPAEQANAS